MKTPLNLLLLTVVLFITACDKESEEPSAPDFELEVDAAFIDEGHDVWIFFHDKNGSTLDHAQLTNGQSRKFTALKTDDDQIGVTLLTVQINELSHKPYFAFESFLGVSKRSKWTLKKPTAPSSGCGDAQGTAEVTIEGDGLGNLYDAFIVAPNYSASPDESQSTSSKFIFFPLDLQAGCDDYFMYVLDKYRIPRYKFVEKLAPGKHTFSLNDFTGFDKVVEFSFPESNSTILSIKALNASQSVYDYGYYTNLCFGDFSEGNFVSSFKAGYLNRYAKYVTTFSATYPPGFVEFTLASEQAGAIPSSLELPATLQPVLKNKNFDNYSFTVNEDFVLLSRYFMYSPLVTAGEAGIDWYIHSGNENNFKNLTLFPQEFLDAYPDYNRDKLQHNWSRFYKQYKTVEALTAERFQGVARPENYLYTSKTVYK